MMASFHGEQGKAAGISDRRRRRNNTDSCVQPCGPYEPVPPSSAYPYSSSYPQEHVARPEGQRHTPVRRHTTTNITRSSPGSRSHSVPQQAKSVSDDWDLVEEDEEETFQEPSPLPTYNFPGSWGAAIHETTAALSQVHAASTSYASALSSSGLGRAGRSIGAALWSTTNKKAVALAGWAVEQSGTNVRELPAPVRGWLNGGRVEEQRRHARTRAVIPYREPLTFGDERGAFVLATREMDNTGEFIEERQEDDGEVVVEEEEDE